MSDYSKSSYLLDTNHYYNSSSSSSSSSNANNEWMKSPLIDLLADLRRKHVAAAGPQQLGFMIDNSHNDDCTTTSYEDEDGRRQQPKLQHSKYDHHNKHYHPHPHRWSGLASSSHVENLLCSTPHLRHLSAASSSHRSGSNSFTSTTKNLLSSLFSLGDNNHHHHKQYYDSHYYYFHDSNALLPNTMDYGTSMAKIRANRDVAMDLAAFVRVLAHEMSLEEFAAAESDVFTSIFSMMHATTDNSKRLAGVAALNALIGVPSSDEEKKAIKFANNLSNGLRANNVDYEFLSAVSKALGRMAMGASNIDYVEFEITRALEWLRIERSDRRLAATLTLKELAQNAPTAFYSKTNHHTSTSTNNEFIDAIFPVLRDPQPIVRVCAADALSEFLKIIVDRKHRSTIGLLCQIYATTMDGLYFNNNSNGNNPLHNNHNNNIHHGDSNNNNSNNSTNANMTVGMQVRMDASQHASLLVLSDLLDHTRDFMLPRFDEVCQAVLYLADNTSLLIQLEVVRLIPRLARRCPGAFGRRYLERGLQILLKNAASPTHNNSANNKTNQHKQRNKKKKRGEYMMDIRPAAFYSLGQLVLSMSNRTTNRTKNNKTNNSNSNNNNNLKNGINQNGKSNTNYKSSSGNGGDTPSIHDDDEEEEDSCGVPQSALEIIKHTPTGNNNDDDDVSHKISVRAKVGDIYANLDQIFALVTSGLRTNASVDTKSAAIHCGADLVEALGKYSLKYMDTLLNDMFESGLSDDLIHCLHSISQRLPSQKPFIEERLLQELSLSLAGTSSASDHTSHHPPPVIDMSEKPHVVNKLVLSLRTLGLLSIQKTLLPFVKNVVCPYLNHPSEHVRKEAAMTCCILLLPPASNSTYTTTNSDQSSQTFKSPLVSHGLSSKSSQSSLSSPGWMIRKFLLPGCASGLLVEDVLETLLRVAVSDVSPNVRHVVVQSLDDVRYDCYMCQSHHLSHLFVLLQDEALAVRAATLRLLGHLARWNPALILPDLRHLLMDILIELRCGGDTGGGREAATRLLVVFLRAEALHRLIHPFLPSIIEALPLKGVAPRLASAAMEALGELAQVSRSSLIPWVPQLVPHILETMQDQSSASKQRTSIRTLGLIAGGTGYVISPYMDYPNLLSLAANVLPGTKRAPWALRREVIRTFGILGALDPDRYYHAKHKCVGSGYFMEFSSSTSHHDTGNTDTTMNTNSNTLLQLMDSATLSKEAPSSYNHHHSTNNNTNTSASTINASLEGEEDARSVTLGGAIKSKHHNNKIHGSCDANDDDDEPAHLYMYELYAMTAQPLSKLPPARRLTPADDEFYPTVAVQALTRILKDSSLAVHHGMVMQAIMFIFNSLGMRCVPFLKRIVPHILQTVRTCGQSSLREALLQQVASLSGIVKDHLRPYVPAIFDVVEELWQSKHFATILLLVDKMAIGVPNDFRRFFPRLVPRFLYSIESIQVMTDWSSHPSSNHHHISSTSASSSTPSSVNTNSNTNSNTNNSPNPSNNNNHHNSASSSTKDLLERLELVLKSICGLRHVLSDYMHLLVPSLLKLTDSLLQNHSHHQHNNSNNVHHHYKFSISRLAARSVQTVSILLRAKESELSSTVMVSSSLHARAVQPLIRMLYLVDNTNKLIGFAMVDAICVCAKLKMWMQLHHVAAQTAILNFQSKCNPLNNKPPIQKYMETIHLLHPNTTLQQQQQHNTTSIHQTSNKVDNHNTTANNFLNESNHHLDHTNKNNSNDYKKNGEFSNDHSNHNNMNHKINGGGTSSASNNNNNTNVDFNISNHGIISNHGMIDNNNINSSHPDEDLASTLLSLWMEESSQQPPSIPVPVILNNQKNKHQVNQANLQRAWDVTQRSTREDWDEWMRRFAVQLLREAPAPALRATAALAHAYQPLARELFSAAFVCCWSDLKEQYRENLLQSLETAFFGDVSPEILQTLLNLAEFMEHDYNGGGGLPIDISILAELALKCRSYAKALHYKEREHSSHPTKKTGTTEYLISINKKLDLPEAALGVLKAAQFELVRHGLQSWGDPTATTTNTATSNTNNTSTSTTTNNNTVTTSSNKDLSVGEYHLSLSSPTNHNSGSPTTMNADGSIMLQSSTSTNSLSRHMDYIMAYSVMSTADEISARDNVVVFGTSESKHMSENNNNTELQESWLAKLGSWSEALAMYERKLAKDPYDVEGIIGCMRCLDARGEWKRVLDLAKTSWDALSTCTTNNMDHKASFSDEKSLLTPTTTSNHTSLNREKTSSISQKVSTNGTPNSGNNKKQNYKKALKFCAKAAWRLGQWDDLELYASKLTTTNNNTSTTVSSSLDYHGAFYSAILHIHRKEWGPAAAAIDSTRRAMDSRFTALMAESYKRAYPSMVTAQTLSEMEEIIDFQKLSCRSKVGNIHGSHPINREDAVEARKQLLHTWRKRLAGCRVDAEVHSELLAVRSLVLGPTDEVESILTLSALSRQSQCFKLAERVLLDPLAELGANLNGRVFGFNLSLPLGLHCHNYKKQQYSSGGEVAMDQLVMGNPVLFLPQYGTSHVQLTQDLIQEAGGLDRLKIQHQYYFAYLQHLWAMNHNGQALERLTKLCNVVDMVSHCASAGNTNNTNDNNNDDMRVSCWLRLGDWKVETNDRTQDVLMAYKRSTASSNCGYPAWHAWALINFRLAQQMHDTTTLNKTTASSSSSSVIRNHVVAAVQGFVKAISIGTKRWSASVEQDMLNFLTCLFKYGELPEVAATINAEICAITLESWLGVLPQLLARIHIRSPSVRSVLHPLLIRLGAKHPQALMYPLSVLLKSPVMERKVAAESLMNSLKNHSNALVEESLMVSSELIRVAILWLELWHEGLEDASRLYFGEGNVAGMLEVLLPLHKQLEQGPSTKREVDFHKSFGRDLADAHAYVKKYISCMEGHTIPTRGGFMPETSVNAKAEAALNQAWDLYYVVFRRINKQLPGLTSLELSQCSPALLHAHNLELGIPGSYRVDGSYVKIERFIPSVQVITSKQRPRKIVLRGSDGKDYVFLLKGHEDLRQDERVMQLFGLVNALLARDRRTNHHDLDIQRYAIAPLSHNAGLVGWVPHCDTLHSLIRDYRESKRIPLNMEHREMMKLSSDYELLTSMQKVEIFSEALDNTIGKGNDLYEVLWIKSMNSEEWLERRTKFTRSLAVMSMVGYILGLGDRHPSNLMLDQISGRVLHIDFGDCFEVAMHRDKFPEKIPFRLTRMLIKGMEVSGIEGSYRSTCERTMSVLRDNRDSLVAMLEAFVDDPLISWRLLNQDTSPTTDDDAATTGTTNNGNGGNKRPTTYTSDDRSSGKSASFAESSTSYIQQQRMVHEPIRESSYEDSLDGDTHVDGNNANTNHSNVVEQQEKGSIMIPSSYNNKKAAATTSTRPQSLRPSHTKSLKIYTSMQAMAASLTTSSRIASLTGSTSVVESKSRSRRYHNVQHNNNKEEALNEKALKVIRRVQDKLTGTDFQECMDVPDQVQRLIVEATSSENLCQLFIGWCAFW